MASPQITVRRHSRRRTGKTAKVALLLGLDQEINVAPYKRRRPTMPMWRHSDDGTLCGDSAKDKGLILTDMRCPHGREVKLV